VPSEHDLIQRIQSHVTRLHQTMAEAEFWHNRSLKQAVYEVSVAVPKLEIIFV
jgi:hypothetical protein